MLLLGMHRMYHNVTHICGHQRIDVDARGACTVGDLPYSDGYILRPSWHAARVLWLHLAMQNMPQSLFVRRHMVHVRHQWSAQLSRFDSKSAVHRHPR
jgi:hypothetical protein